MGWLTMALCAPVLASTNSCGHLARNVSSSPQRLLSTRFCQGEAAVLAAKDASSIKRLAYIARRVRFLQELVVCNIIDILDIDGKENPADALTKHISPKIAFSEYMSRMYNIATALFRLKAV